MPDRNLSAVPEPEDPADTTGPRLRPSDLEGIPLGDHDGVPISQFAAKVTKAGDGLSESMRLSPMHLPIGGHGVLVMPFTVVSHEYDYVKDGRTRIESERLETAVLEADGALLVDPDLVEKVVAEHMTRILDARERAAREKREKRGEFELPFADNDDVDGVGGP